MNNSYANGFISRVEAPMPSATDVLELALLDLIGAGRLEPEEVVSSLEKAVREIGEIRSPEIVKQIAILMNSLHAAKPRRRTQSTTHIAKRKVDVDA